MIHRKDEHLPWRWLAERLDGTLPADRAAEADAHLAGGCAHCAARDAGVRRIVAALRAGPLERAPAAADRRAVALWARHRAARARPAEGALVGTLVLDQREDLALALRADGRDDRRVLWSLGPFEVDAGIVARNGRSDVLGQIVPAGDVPDAAVGGEVRAVRGARRVAVSQIAPDGRFTFRGLTAGAYRIEGDVRSPADAAPRAFVLPMLVLE